jgi:hypothetical protein
MNPYAMLSSGIGTSEGTSLSTRLAAWHDAMVAHERRLRSGSTSDACNDECPHADARTLWSEALEAFGVRANELGFLRSHALAAAGRGPDAARRESPAELAEWTHRSRRGASRTSAPGRQSFARSSDRPPASAEL